MDCHGFPAISLDRRVNDNRAIAAMIGLGGFIVILSFFYYSLIIYIYGITAAAICRVQRLSVTQRLKLHGNMTINAKK
jgi:uncharacterized BrkB/YihY/UPF0761 family membrane protein